MAIAETAGSASRDSQSTSGTIAPRLQRSRQRVTLLRMVLGGCLLATSALALLGAICLADYRWELAWSTRAIALGVALAAVVSGIIGLLRAVRGYRLHDAAVELEREQRKYGQRLRTALDYHQPDAGPAAAHPALVRALDRETQRLARDEDFTHVGPRGWAALAACGLAAAVLIALVSLAANSELRTSAGRTLLLPWEYTTVTFTPLESTIRRGESVEIAVEVTGRPVDLALVRFRPQGQDVDWTKIELAPPERNESDDAPVDETDPSKAVPMLVATIADCQENLSFEVLAGPRKLPPGSIRVLQPVSIESHQARVTPPEYTGRQPEQHERWEFKVLEGSNVELVVRLNRPVAEAALVPRAMPEPGRPRPGSEDSASAAAASVPVSIDGATLIARLTDLRQRGTWQLTAKAADSIELPPQRLTIRVQPDARPTVKFLEPDEELEVTPTTDLRFAVEAGDDLGLVRVGITAQVAGEPARVLWSQEMTGATDSPLGATNTVQGAAELLLEQHRVTIQDAVTYHAFAEDNYFGQPRRTSTPLRFVDIRPYKRAYQMLESGGSCNGCSVTLEELIARQRKNLSLTYSVAERGDASTADAERLVTNERELLAATHELASGLAQRGQPVPAIEDAAKAMRRAAEDLTRGNIPLAVVTEQLAVDCLVRARKNMRQMLTPPNSQSASACRKFDRQQRQKLRTPEQKEQERQQQLAQARSKLNELAQKQREWSEELRRQCGGPQRDQQNNQQAKSPEEQKQQQQASSSSPSSSSSSSQKSGSQSQSESRQQASSNQQQQEQANNGEQQQQQAGESQSQQSENSQLTAAERDAAAEAQRKLLDELRETQRKLDELRAGSQAAQAQADRAADAMQQGLNELEQSQPQQAADQGDRAADQLQATADHLAGMNNTDFGDRLRQASQLADRLAERQQRIGERIGGRQPSNNAQDGESGQQSSAGQSSDGQSSGEQTSQQGDGASSNDGEAKSSTGGSEKADEDADEGSGRGSLAANDRKSMTAGERADLAAQERDLAAGAQGLEELLGKLRADSLGEQGEVHEGLSSLRQELPAEEIAGQLQSAAEALEASDDARAADDAQSAAAALDDLAGGLRRLRGDYSQPELDELVALEQELAQLLEQLSRAGDVNEAEALAARWEELRERLNELADGDRRLADALDAHQQTTEQSASQGNSGQESSSQAAANQADSRQAGANDPNAQVRGPHARRWNGDVPPGLYWLKLGNFNGLRQVSKALQSKIQEAILAGALLDADEPVPPEYRELVDEYYRALSDDLR